MKIYETLNSLHNGVITRNREVKDLTSTFELNIKYLRPSAWSQADFIANFEVTDFFPFAFVIFAW